MAVPPDSPRRPPPANEDIAAALDRVAVLLDQQRVNPYKGQAYRAAAETVRHRRESVAGRALREGVRGLQRLPGVGAHIAQHIDTYVRTGRLPLLEQLEGEVDPERLLTSVPGIGPRTARELHLRLGISRLEDLQRAAADGRLGRLAGFGSRRVAGLQMTLAGMLGQPLVGVKPPALGDRPPLAFLLQVDADYRRRAEAGDLPLVAPRRFNPRRAAWLPILHAEREGWTFAAAYANTARAHELGKVRDWVMIYFEHEDVAGQYTVQTASEGPLRGRRIVLGRESECVDYYRRIEPHPLPRSRPRPPV